MSKYQTLISVEELMALQRGNALQMLFDCSFDLMKPEAGVSQYRDLHIAGAVYANLDTDLSAKHGVPGARGEVVVAQADEGPPASGGRHPLPSREKFAAWLSSIGFANNMQAVVYDRNGANYCGRLWWMLKWMGHEAVAVLDGGLAAWQRAGGAPVTDPATPRPVAPPYPDRAPLTTSVDADAIVRRLGSLRVLDARAPERFRGEIEPIDAVAGHIPGALNRFHRANLGADGRFKPAAQLRAEYATLLGGADASTIAHQCGSGVTACHNLLAMEQAGLTGSALYPGSWSEWSADPARPIARGG